MNSTKDWRVCFEIGLNHLGDFKNISNILEVIKKSKNNCALTVQIREEDFYKNGKDHLRLDLEQYLELRKRCLDLNIQFGIALGPLEDLDWIANSGLDPDFLKLLGIASNNLDFIDAVSKSFSCPKFFSVGLSSIEFIHNSIAPRMSENDGFIHTSLSHASEDQNLVQIKFLKSLGKPVFFGQHSSTPAICFAAIGAGADKLFVYIGDKNLDLPDHDHAISLNEINHFEDLCMECFRALGNVESGEKKSKIEFIG